MTISRSTIKLPSTTLLAFHKRFSVDAYGVQERQVRHIGGVFLSRLQEKMAMQQDRLQQLRETLADARLSRRSALKGAGAVGMAAGASSLPLGAAMAVNAQEKMQIRLGTWAAIEEAAELQVVLDAVNAEATDFEIISEPQPSDYYTSCKPPSRAAPRPIFSGSLRNLSRATPASARRWTSPISLKGTTPQPPI